MWSVVEFFLAPLDFEKTWAEGTHNYVAIQCDKVGNMPDLRGTLFGVISKCKTALACTCLPPGAVEFVPLSCQRIVTFL
jgi:hypothetical protein